MSTSNLSPKYSQIASIFSSLLLAYTCYMTLVQTPMQAKSTKREMLLTQSFPENGEPKGRRRGGTSRETEYIKIKALASGNVSQLHLYL